MMRRVLLAWGVVTAALVLWMTWRLSSSAQAYETAWTAATSTVQQVNRLNYLRQNHAAPSLGPRPDGDLVSRAQQALEAAGLPTAIFNGVQPRETEQSGSGGWSIQRTQLRLLDMRPVEFARWLQAWHAQLQPWQVDAVEFVHQRVANDQVAEGLDNDRYQINVEVSAPFVEEPR